MDKDALNGWIVEKMRSRGWSMRELGRQSGVPYSTISDNLSGKKDSGLEIYIKIAQAFDAVPEMLEVAGVIPTEEGLRSSLLEQVKAVMRLSPEQQQQFIDYGRFLVQQSKRQNEGGESNDLAADSG